MDEPPGNVFNLMMRHKLLYNILNAPIYEGGCGLEISQLLLQKKIAALFPLHDADSATLILREVEFY